MSDETEGDLSLFENIQGQESDNLLNKLHQAGQQQAAGNMAEAEQAYELILKQEPNNKFANQLLGGMALQRGDFNRAYKFISSALAVDPKNEELNSNLGIVLIKLQRLGESFDLRVPSGPAASPKQFLIRAGLM